MKTLALAVPDRLHDQICRIAKEEAKPTKDIVRHALRAGLAMRRQRDCHRAILEYALRVAGSIHDLDADLETAALECLHSSLSESK